jgi:cob(I)alamin adenosyltransferase
MRAVPTYFTRTGDDGTTGLLGAQRVPKHHPRPEAYGAVDEASAALGLARALALSPETAHVVKAVQRDLYHLMAELAATPDRADQFRRIDPARVAWLESEVTRFGQEVHMPEEFVLAGDSPSGAAMDVARAIVRRAERRVARLHHEGELPNPEGLKYLNRLSSLCFVLSLWENQQAGVTRPTLAKSDTSPTGLNVES